MESSNTIGKELSYSIVLFNDFLLYTGDYNSRQFIISRGGSRGW